MKSILITGGAGFIGINTADYFLKKGYNVTILDNFSRVGSRSNVQWLQDTNPHQPTVVEADIVTDRKKLTTEVAKSDIVFHFASQVAVTTSIKDPMHDFNVNALGTMHVLEAIRNSDNNPILLYSSTNKVYGDLITAAVKEEKTRYSLIDFPLGIPETYPMSFKSPYGCSKGAGDQYVHDYHTIYGLKTIVFRQSCIYGPRQFGIEDQGWVAWFIIALLFGKEITIYGNGKQVRDLLHIQDLTKAYELAINNIETTNGQIYNIGGGVNNTISVWIELQPILEKLLNKEIKAHFTEDRPGDQKIFVADISKAKKDFSWEPKTSVEEGVKTLFSWVQENKLLFTDYLTYI